jgi:hypothetical protein
MTCARSIARLIDLRDRLSREANRDMDELRRRDRAIGRELQSLRDHPQAQIFAWLDRVGPDTDSPGRRVAHGLRIAGWMMLGAGLLFGGAAAVGLLYYDGSQPVNIVHSLAVFVGAQLLLLVLLAIASLGSTGSLLGISPGLYHAIARLLPQASRQAAEQFIAQVRRDRRVFGRVYKWLVLTWTQTFALAFNVGAVAAALYMIVFTDIAFGWSTTLDIEPATFHRATNALASPWTAWLPDANPSATFVEATRYFRLQDSGFPSGDEPVTLGGWWPFLIACMVCYGLLPRVVTAVIARWRLASAIHHSAAHAPGVAQLRDRLNSEWIVTQANGEEAAAQPTTTKTAAQPRPADGAAVAINWSGVDIDEAQLPQRLQLAIDRTLQAGGANTPADDARVVDAARDARRIVILVRAFEPPMGEFVDFVAALRDAIGDGKAIEVVPIDATAQQLGVWRSKLATTDDPWLSVREVA